MECKDCVYIKQLEERCKRLEEVDKTMDERVKRLELNEGRFEERMVTLFNMITEIKTSIDKLSIKIDTLEKKPGKTYENLVYEVVKYAVVAAVAFAVAKLF